MKKVLAVGMFDSVHFARWLSQFKNFDGLIEIFPSSKFRRIHPKLIDLVKLGCVSLAGQRNSYWLTLAGYSDYLRYEYLKQFSISPHSRSKQLKRILNKSEYDLVHLIEIQHAGYLYLDSKPQIEPDYKLIVTNYGSDLIYFKEQASHLVNLKELLSIADYYSAECRRDYILARELGFSGTELPLMPNGGGFDENFLRKPKSKLSARTKIYVKGYGGTFGLGQIALEVTRMLMLKYEYLEVVVVSLTSDLEREGERLLKDFGPRVKIYCIGEKVDHSVILEFLSNSVLTLGISRSDGISTTFLEALISGAIPIQTNTSCAGEWVEKGFFAKVVPADLLEIYDAACEVLNRIEFYEASSIKNQELAGVHLSRINLMQQAQKFYSSEVGH